jgi:hypothetical protein
MSKAATFVLTAVLFFSMHAFLHAQNPTWEEYRIVINTDCSLAQCEESNGDEYYYFWMPESTAWIGEDSCWNTEPLTTTMYLKDVTPSKFALSFNTLKDWMLDNTDATLRIYYWSNEPNTIAGVGLCGKSGP